MLVVARPVLPLPAAMSEGEEGLVDIVDRARSAFNNNEFTKAVDLFSQALSTDPSNVELLVCRAHAHTKAENYPAGTYLSLTLTTMYHNASKFMEKFLEIGIFFGNFWNIRSKPQGQKTLKSST